MSSFFSPIFDFVEGDVVEDACSQILALLYQCMILSTIY